MMEQEAPVGSADIMHGAALARRPVGVLLVEDSVVIAQRLTEALAPLPEFRLIDIVDTESKALDAIGNGGVDILLLDLHLRDGTGFGVLRSLRHRRSKPLVVVLTNHDLPEYHTAAVELGVSEFLDKARAFHRLPVVLHEMLHSFRID